MRRARSPIAGTLLGLLRLLLRVRLRLLLVFGVERARQRARSPQAELSHAEHLSARNEHRRDAERPVVAQSAQKSLRCAAEAFFEEALRGLFHRLVARDDAGDGVENTENAHGATSGPDRRDL